MRERERGRVESGSQNECWNLVTVETGGRVSSNFISKTTKKTSKRVSMLLLLGGNEVKCAELETEKHLLSQMLIMCLLAAAAAFSGGAYILIASR